MICEPSSSTVGPSQIPAVQPAAPPREPAEQIHILTERIIMNLILVVEVVVILPEKS
jgi:hypothetical protein